MDEFLFDDRADYDGDGRVDEFEQALFFAEMEEEDAAIAAGGLFGGGSPFDDESDDFDDFDDF